MDVDVDVDVAVVMVVLVDLDLNRPGQAAAEGVTCTPATFSCGAQFPIDVI